MIKEADPDGTGKIKLEDALPGVEKLIPQKEKKKKKIKAKCGKEIKPK
jgi:hypothetical protein